MSEETAAEERIAKALIKLLQDENLERISITDITTAAGVSRVSYYRHYSSKEEILIKHASCVLDGIVKEIQGGSLRSGSVFWRKLVETLKDTGLVSGMENAGLLYDFYNLFIERLNIILSTVMCLDMKKKTNIVLLEFIAGGLVRLLNSKAMEDEQITDDDVVAFLRALGEKVLM